MRSAHHLEWDRTLEIDGSNPHPHQKTMLIDLSKLFIQSLLTRHANFLQSFNSSIPICKLLI
jgi:hypothetical protein